MTASPQSGPSRPPTKINSALASLAMLACESQASESQAEDFSITLAYSGSGKDANLEISAASFVFSHQRKEVFLKTRI